MPRAAPSGAGHAHVRGPAGLSPRFRGAPPRYVTSAPRPRHDAAVSSRHDPGSPRRRDAGVARRRGAGVARRRGRLPPRPSPRSRRCRRWPLTGPWRGPRRPPRQTFGPLAGQGATAFRPRRHPSPGSPGRFGASPRLPVRPRRGGSAPEQAALPSPRQTSDVRRLSGPARHVSPSSPELAERRPGGPAPRTRPEAEPRTRALRPSRSAGLGRSPRVWPGLGTEPHGGGRGPGRSPTGRPGPGAESPCQGRFRGGAGRGRHSP